MIDGLFKAAIIVYGGAFIFFKIIPDIIKYLF